MSSPLIKLNSGESIPAIGTWQSKPNDVARAVEAALSNGYRHSDCAWTYGNEREVGEGLRASGVPRSEVFITSKLWGTCHTRVEECLDQTISYVAMNANGNHPVFPTRPNGNRDIDESRELKDTWKDMEATKGRNIGKVKSIGVSNSPLLNDEVAAEVPDNYSLKTPDVLLGYPLAKGMVVLPKSVTLVRIEVNFIGASGTYSKLTAEDVAKLDGVAAGGASLRLLVTPPWGVDLGFDTGPSQLVKM
ncbi:hypothetical protein PAXRUDRAFT_34185 [Paxillus rubicundulus Ve08.2h10]|uniref:NADP-dependent oxidoreductase domain-containing protein n=1 Tax=Paxillus rubicundulus Ve08.2h10 TaxID=930991 RepID=A0A0D0DN44_9AGAM|nr:hypothetical protein PAXRUDRAFT_34185 [Paxillus rubicundulus Ve08.2h10]